MIRPAASVGIPALATCVAAAGVGVLTSSRDFKLWAVALLTVTSLGVGLSMSWRLGRKGAPEIEDAIGWGIAALIIAVGAPFVLFVILFQALGGGQ